MSNVWNDQYRHEQEAFVSNHGGSTSREVLFILMPNLLSVPLAITTTAILGKYVRKNVRVLIEFLTMVVPCILCCTVLSEHISSVCMTMILICIINVAFMGINVNTLSNYAMQPAHGRRPFITNFRALTNIISTVCILAIDFPIFPRKFAKTEVFGYSLMDTGVGLFILSNALVAPEARDFKPKPKISLLYTLTNNIKSSTKSCIPLLILGFGRSIAIECLGYQKHVTEYGVHWNFFITLAFVKLFTSSITSIINSNYSLLSGIWILFMHEYILSTKGLKEWVLSDEPRGDLVSANREGLVSVPGYVGLYLIGVALGRIVHSRYQNLEAQHAVQYKQTNFRVKIFGYEFDGSYNKSMVLCVELSLIAVQACAATLLCDSYFRVSRRLANAGYCFWIVTLTTTYLTLLLLAEIIIDILVYATMNQEHTVTKRNRHKMSSKNKQECVSDECEKSMVKRTLEIFEAVNYNGLFFFLVANLVTGGINMLIQTLYVKELKAVQILIGYMAITITSVLVLYRQKIQFKL